MSYLNMLSSQIFICNLTSPIILEPQSYVSHAIIDKFLQPASYKWTAHLIYLRLMQAETSTL